MDLQELFKEKWTRTDSYVVVVGVAALSIILLAFAIQGGLSPTDFATCTVSFEGNFGGVIDLNKEALAVNNWVNEFEINSLSGGVTITAPCSLLQDRGLFE